MGYAFSGQLTRITRPDGESLFLDYDLETGQVTAQVPSVGSTIGYQYDSGTGNLEEVSSAAGQVLTYAYNGDLPTSETWSVQPGGVGVTGSVSRTYDNSFRVLSQSVNGANTIGFAYDNDDLLSGAGALTLGRDGATGLLIGTAIDTATDSYGYNALAEVISHGAIVNGVALYSVAYTRDAVGRIAAKTETVQGVTDVYNYVYDAAGRLTDVRQNGTLIGHYEYDLNGNRVPDADGDQSLTFNQAGTLISATYDNQDRLLELEQGPAAVAYAYSANGELWSRTVGTDVTSYAYDVLGNLRQVVLPATPTPMVIDYPIDGQNRRVGKAINGTVVRGWLYDGQLRIVAELDGSNVLVSRFVYATKTNVPD